MRIPFLSGWTLNLPFSVYTTQAHLDVHIHAHIYSCYSSHKAAGLVILPFITSFILVCSPTFFLFGSHGRKWTTNGSNEDPLGNEVQISTPFNASLKCLGAEEHGLRLQSEDNKRRAGAAEIFNGFRHRMTKRE